MEDAVQYYVNQDGDALSRLLDPVLAQLPDQGIEASTEHKTTATPGGASSSAPPAKPKATPPDAKPMTACLVCKRKHLPLCPLPDGFGRQQRERKKVKKAEKKSLAKAKAAA